MVQVFFGDAIDELGGLKLGELRLFGPIVPPRPILMMVVDNPDEIPKLHAFVILLDEV